MDEQLRVDIKVGADVSGARAAEAAVRGVANATDAAGKSTREAAGSSRALGQNLGQAAQAGGQAAAIFKGLEGASKGGAEGILGMVGAVRGFITLLRGAVAGSGPIGLLIAALGVIGGLALALADKFKPATKSIEDLKKETDDAKKSANELGALQLDGLKAQIASVSEGQKGFREEIEKTIETQARLDEARKQAELSALAADTKVRPEERLLREQQINLRFAARSDEREVLKAGIGKTLANREVIGQEGILSKAQESFRIAAEALDAAAGKNRTFFEAQEGLGPAQRLREELPAKLADYPLSQEERQNTIAAQDAQIEGMKSALRAGPTVGTPQMTALTEQFATALKGLTLAEDAVKKSRDSRTTAEKQFEQTKSAVAEAARLRTETARTDLAPKRAEFRAEEIAKRKALSEERASLEEKIGSGNATDEELMRFTEVQKLQSAPRAKPSLDSSLPARSVPSSSEGSKNLINGKPASDAVAEVAAQTKPFDLSPITQAQEQAAAATQKNMVEFVNALGQVVQVQGDISAQIGELRRQQEATARAISNSKSTQ